MVWHLDVGSSHPGAGEGPKYRDWVQNVVRQFGPYPLQALEYCEDLPLVREDRGGQTSDVSVVTPVA